MNSPEVNPQEDPGKDFKLNWQTPVRESSATSVPLNNTAALLGPELNKQRMQALEALSHSRMRILPDVAIS